MNIEECLHNNIKIPLNYNNHICHHFDRLTLNDKLLNKFIYKKCKFACYNSMSSNFIESFKKLMNTVLNIDKKCNTNNCNFLRHTDKKNNDGKHCCSSCEKNKIHASNCQKKIL
jgi:hypothetical protein